jgi:hypothetical protein
MRSRYRGPSAQMLLDEVQLGSRLVVYQYCISLFIVSYKRSSGIKSVRPGQSAVVVGLPYTLISLVAGWWGIPWGPFWTIRTMWRNLKGGVDVTPARLAPAAPSVIPPGVRTEPRLSPEAAAIFAAISPSMRERIVRAAVVNASAAAASDRTRDLIRDRDAYIEREVTGTNNLWLTQPEPVAVPEPAAAPDPAAPAEAP